MLSPEYKLIYSIIRQAILDKDYKFLKSRLCKYYLSWVDIDHEVFISYATNPSKKNDTYPSYFYNINPDNYRICRVCKCVKYLNSMKRSQRIDNILNRNRSYEYSNICRSCHNVQHNKYNRKRRAVIKTESLNLL